MITLLQRVAEARVEVGDEVVGRIGAGLLVLVGVQAADNDETARHFVERLLNYRVFADADGKMNRSLADVDGGLLLVPQFTLAANTKKGRRPSFTSAANPAHGEAIYARMLEQARERHARVESGRFGAHMRVQLVNDGPVTFILD